MQQPPQREVYQCPARIKEKRSDLYVTWGKEGGEPIVRVPDPRAIKNSLHEQGRMNTYYLKAEESRPTQQREVCLFSGATSCQSCMAYDGHLFPEERKEKILKEKGNKSNPESA